MYKSYISILLLTALISSVSYAGSGLKSEWDEKYLEKSLCEYSVKQIRREKNIFLQFVDYEYYLGLSVASRAHQAILNDPDLRDEIREITLAMKDNKTCPDMLQTLAQFAEHLSKNKRLDNFKADRVDGELILKSSKASLSVRCDKDLPDEFQLYIKRSLHTEQFKNSKAIKVEKFFSRSPVVTFPYKQYVVYIDNLIFDYKRIVNFCKQTNDPYTPTGEVLKDLVKSKSAFKKSVPLFEFDGTSPEYKPAVHERAKNNNEDETSSWRGP